MRCTWLLLVSAACASCANHAKQSISLYEAGDYAGASRAADSELAQHPDDDSLWGMRVRAALALGDPAAVAKAYDAYVARRGSADKALLRDLSTATVEQALASPSARLQIQAIDAIAELRLVDLERDVVEKLGAKDDQVAAAAAIAILYDHPQAPEVADMMLRSENAEARRLTLEGIAKKGQYRRHLELAVSDLENAVTDIDPGVRAIAVRWLGVAKDKNATALVANRLLHDRDASVRAAAAKAIAQIGGVNFAPLAKHVIADEALSVRLAAIELFAAGHLNDDLAALAKDPDPSVALAAALAIAPPRPELVSAAIERAAAAPEWTTRAGAANVLEQALGKAGALPVAQKLAADQDVAVRLAAARVLERVGDPEGARSVLAAALTSEQGVQAAADLSALGDDRGLAALAAFTRDLSRTPEQRAEAVAAHRLAHHVTAALVGALADPNGIVRIEAAATLGELAK